MEKITHENNVYAYNLKNEVKHISEVVSGKKGYYCIGCEAEMIARKGQKIAHCFAHVPKMFP